jgi:hypothetical protein
MVEGVRALIVSGGHLLWAAPKQLPITWPGGTTYEVQTAAVPSAAARQLPSSAAVGQGLSLRLLQQLRRSLAALKEERLRLCLPSEALGHGEAPLMH